MTSSARARQRRLIGLPVWVAGLLAAGMAGAADAPEAVPPAASPASAPESAPAVPDTAPAPEAPASAASAADTPAKPSVDVPTRYVLGLSMAYVPEYEGAQRRVLKARPLWAWQKGRYRISTSGAGAVLAFGLATPDTGAGASADFVRTDKLRFGAALRIDNGRTSSDSPDLAGVPDVRRTVRARAFVSYALSPHWGVAASASQDLLGRGGGALGSVDLGYHARLGEKTEWSAGLGMRFGNRQYMNTRYGVPPEAALPTRPAYDAGASIETITTGVGITTALSSRWIAFGSLGAESLRGSAAASPLTRSSTGSAATVGIAWRCCNY